MQRVLLLPLKFLVGDEGQVVREFVPGNLLPKDLRSVFHFSEALSALRRVRRSRYWYAPVHASKFFPSLLWRGNQCEVRQTAALCHLPERDAQRHRHP